jgi:putative tryptophan/tyrosine transport system substrate-binding protein
LDALFQRLAHERVGLVFVFADAFFLQERQRIAALAIEAKPPTLCGFRDLVEAGGLISYGVNSASFHHAATFMDKILKGAKPRYLLCGNWGVRFRRVIHLPPVAPK